LDCTITAKHLRLTDALKAHVEEKISKLHRYYDGVGHVEVVLNADNPGLVKVEVIAKARRGDVFVATHDGQDVTACVDAAIEKLTRQLTKKKGISRDHRHPGGKGVA